MYSPVAVGKFLWIFDVLSSCMCSCRICLMSPSGCFLSDAFGDLLAYVYGVFCASVVCYCQFQKAWGWSE